LCQPQFKVFKSFFFLQWYKNESLTLFFHSVATVVTPRQIACCSPAAFTWPKRLTKTVSILVARSQVWELHALNFAGFLGVGGGVSRSGCGVVAQDDEVRWACDGEHSLEILMLINGARFDPRPGSGQIISRSRMVKAQTFLLIPKIAGIWSKGNSPTNFESCLGAKLAGLVCL